MNEILFIIISSFIFTSGMLLFATEWEFNGEVKLGIYFFKKFIYKLFKKPNAK